MKTEAQITITLDDREIRLAKCNSGLVILLPTPTQHILLRVEQDEALQVPGP